MEMKEIIDLGKIPLVNNLFDTEIESLNSKRFPLRIIQDKDLVMKLDTEIDSDEMFSNYLYRSGVNKPYIEHCKKMWNSIKKYKPSTIVDIGGNDGTLLKTFKNLSNKKLNLINVDASSSFRKDNESLGIKYYNNYWGDLLLDEKVDLITSTNVFQHNPNYKRFLKGMKNNLNGIWVLEFPYFLDTIKTNQFDQIYHEHVYYWLVTPLVKIFREYGFKILDISEQSIHGGSLRIISSNRDKDKENIKIINKYLNLEKKFNFNKWSKDIKIKIKKDKQFISSLKGNIALFGAAAKGCVYLNSLDINHKFKYIIDDTKEKQNKFSPGTGLKIVDRSIIKEDKIDCILILAHNFKDYIAKSLRKDGFKGQILVMLPKVKII
jgi:hypothetical protein